MDKDTLVIASSANERFGVGLAVLLCSIVMSNRVPNIRFYIVDDEILPETKNFIVKKVTDLGLSLGVAVEIRTINMATIAMPDLPAMKGSFSSYARMFFPELLEESSIYYVDSDIICNLPFPSLAEMESLHGDKLIAGCRDMPDYVALDKVWEQRCGGGLYVNAGFIWMNLRLMREEKITQKIVEGKDIIEGIAKKITPFHDQTLINCNCYGRIGEMSAKFNNVGIWANPDAGMGLDENWHFVGNIKPWLSAGELGHLTKTFYVYHVIVRKLGMEGRLPYAEPYLPLSNAEYFFRHLIAARLRLRSKKRFQRFTEKVKIYQDSLALASAYAERLDGLLKPKSI